MPSQGGQQCDRRMSNSERRSDAVPSSSFSSGLSCTKLGRMSLDFSNTQENYRRILEAQYWGPRQQPPPISNGGTVMRNGQQSRNRSRALDSEAQRASVNGLVAGCVSHFANIAKHVIINHNGHDIVREGLAQLQQLVNGYIAEYNDSGVEDGSSRCLPSHSPTLQTTDSGLTDHEGPSGEDNMSVVSNDSWMQNIENDLRLNHEELLPPPVQAVKKTTPAATVIESSPESGFENEAATARKRKSEGPTVQEKKRSIESSRMSLRSSSTSSFFELSLSGSSNLLMEVTEPSSQIKPLEREKKIAPEQKPASRAASKVKLVSKSKISKTKRNSSFAAYYKNKMTLKHWRLKMVGKHCRIVLEGQKANNDSVLNPYISWVSCTVDTRLGARELVTSNKEFLELEGPPKWDVENPIPIEIQLGFKRGFSQTWQHKLEEWREKAMKDQSAVTSEGQKVISLDQAGLNCTRSGRPVVKPLEWWKGEALEVKGSKLLYTPVQSESPGSLQSSVNSTVNPELKKTRPVHQLNYNSDSFIFATPKVVSFKKKAVQSTVTPATFRKPFPVKPRVSSIPKKDHPSPSPLSQMFPMAKRRDCQEKSNSGQVKKTKDPARDLHLAMLKNYPIDKHIFGLTSTPRQSPEPEARTSEMRKESGRKATQHQSRAMEREIFARKSVSASPRRTRNGEKKANNAKARPKSVPPPKKKVATRKNSLSDKPKRILENSKSSPAKKTPPKQTPISQTPTKPTEPKARQVLEISKKTKADGQLTLRARLNQLAIKKQEQEKLRENLDSRYADALYEEDASSVGSNSLNLSISSVSSISSYSTRRPVNNKTCSMWQLAASSRRRNSKVEEELSESTVPIGPRRPEDAIWIEHRFLSRKGVGKKGKVAKGSESESRKSGEDSCDAVMDMESQAALHALRNGHMDGLTEYFTSQSDNDKDSDSDTTDYYYSD